LDARESWHAFDALNNDGSLERDVIAFAEIGSWREHGRACHTYGPEFADALELSRRELVPLLGRTPSTHMWRCRKQASRAPRPSFRLKPFLWSRYLFNPYQVGVASQR